MEKEYTLGSGHIHIQEYRGTLPTNWDEFFASTENILGRVKGGASFEYTTEKYEDQDDLGYVVIEEITKEKVTMKSGMMTWDGETLEKLCSTARIEKLTDGTTRIKIGGLGNQKNSRYPLRWNAHGEECTEWTYEALVGLSLAIAAYVAPTPKLLKMLSLTDMEQSQNIQLLLHNAV